MPVFLSGIFMFLSTLIGLYSFVIFIRVIMTWMPGSYFGRAGEILAAITDPYLNFFRRLGWFRIGGLDFSLIGAYIFLNILSQIFVSLGTTATLSLSLLLIIFVHAIAGGVGFILWFLLVLTVVRVLVIFLRIPAFQAFWKMLDSLLQPLVYPIYRKLFPNRIIPYGTSLLGLAGGLLLTIFLGRFLVFGLSFLFGLIPI